MWELRLISIGFLIIYNLDPVFSAVSIDKGPSSERDVEKVIFKGYNNKIRPVKKEDTVTQVTVFLNIAHVEKVDEYEQTALVHGHLWASWTDEYLTWDKNDFNMTKITVQPFRIWQPAFSLYNSARGNAWHLYMNGLPATVYYTGKVWASGTFSFYVTCQFDFTDWPFDQQTCPIVIADWVYGLAQVNLSDPNNMAEYAKPTVRLSYDPIDKKNKKHVGGWEIQDAWKKHCYWGPKGCKDEQPEGDAEWYWSLLEFGIKIKRHTPFFALTILGPFLLTSVLTLCIFWIDTFPVCVGSIIFNIFLQGIYGWDMIRKMPPGSGTTPKIVQAYTMNLIISSVQMIIIIVSKFLEDSLPKTYELKFGFDITEIPKRLGVDRFFAPKGISFDPQLLLNPEEPPESLESMLERGGGGSSSSITGFGNVLGQLEDDPQTSSPGTSENSFLISLPTNEEPPDALLEDVRKEEEEKKKKTTSNETKLQLQLHHIKRYSFLIVVLIYSIVFLLCLIF